MNVRSNALLTYQCQVAHFFSSSIHVKFYHVLVEEKIKILSYFIFKARLIVLERPPNYQYVVLCVSADEVGGGGGCTSTRWTLSVHVRDFPTLICHPSQWLSDPSRRKCIHLQIWGWGGGARPAQDHRNCRKKSLMVKDNYQLFMCVVVYVYD
jgi:hypothetical protein